MPLSSEFRRLAGGLVLALTLFLAACAQPPRPQGAHGPQPAPTARGPVPDSPVKIGRPYQIAGVWYTPADEAGYDEVGYASWYGEAFHGGPTANGERFDMNDVSAAHKTLPLPSYVEVTALETGRTILVRVNDRGPFVSNRIIDLSRRSAEMLGITRKGVAPVRVRRVEPGEADRLALRKGGPASERAYVTQSELASLDRRFRTWLAAQQATASRPALASRVPEPARSIAAPAPVSGPVSAPVTAPVATAVATPAAAQSPAPLSASMIGGWFVQVGAYGDRGRADGLAQALGATIESVGDIHRVRIGPYFEESIALAALARMQRDGYGDARLIRPSAVN